jgi:hypothetical protein
MPDALAFEADAEIEKNNSIVKVVIVSFLVLKP